jgi:oligoribonuclease
MSIENVLWFDIETTGLDPDKDVILEVGYDVVTPDMESLEQVNMVPHHELEIIRSLMSPEILAQHNKSRLLLEVDSSELNLNDIEQFLIAVADTYFKDKKIILAGNSIHFDRKFIDKQIPTFRQRLHYRMIDVSSIREAVRIFCGKHRSLEDIDESKATFKQLLKRF